MIKFLVNIFTAPFRVIADLGDAIIKGLKVLWGGLTALGRGVRTAWNWMVAGAKAIGSILERVALDVYHFGKWLLTVQLPKWAKWAITEAGKAGAAILRAASAFATKLYNLARAFAQTIVNTLAAWAHDAVNWLTRTLADAWNLLRSVAKIVGDLLTDADKLAAWAMGAIWRLFWKLFLASIRPIARAVFANLVHVALSSMQFVESIIADVIGGQ